MRRSFVGGGCVCVFWFRTGHSRISDFFSGSVEVFVKVEFGVSSFEEIFEEAVAKVEEVVGIVILPPVAQECAVD